MTDSKAIINSTFYKQRYQFNNQKSLFILTQKQSVLGNKLSFTSNNDSLDDFENASKQVQTNNNRGSKLAFITGFGLAIVGLVFALKSDKTATIKQTVSSAINKVKMSISPSLKEVRNMHSNLGSKDNTIEGFFNIERINNHADSNVIKVNGKKIKLPDFDDSDDCLKWWQKNISKKPLNLKDKEKVKVLTRLPKRIQTKIIASLSRRGVKLTEYDDLRLIKYRADLNNRRILINLRDAVPTKKGQAVIDSVSEGIYNQYAKKGLKKEKKLFIMVGQKAAGKSTLLNHMSKEHGVLVADSDEIRHIIGSQETELHGRLKYAIKDNLADMAIKDGTNFLAQFHGTGTGKALEIINKFKQAGYEVEVVNIEVPEEKLINRIFKRRESANKDADPLSVILYGKKEQKNNFFKIGEICQADTITCYNNDVKYGDPPIKGLQRKKYKVICSLK